MGVDGVRAELNDGKGLSVVMVNSPDAEKMVSEGIFRPGSVEITIDEVIPGNPMLLRPSTPQHDVGAFWRAYNRGGFEGAARYVGAYGLKKKVKVAVKRLLRRDIN